MDIAVPVGDAKTYAFACGMGMHQWESRRAMTLRGLLRGPNGETRPSEGPRGCGANP
jgi:hypothetical protein